MEKGDIVKLVKPPDEKQAKERYLLLGNPEGSFVSAETICDFSRGPTRILSLADIVIDKKRMAFNRSRLRASGSACERCGEVKLFPDGLGLYEEPYCEAVWLCEECYPEVEQEDDD